MNIIVKDEKVNLPLNIFLVEDDDGDAKAVTRAFSKVQIANPIVRSFDGQDALDALRGENGHSTIPTPHIILLDLNMPRMNGIQFLQEIRNDPKLKRLIVFVLTTSKNDQDKIDAYNLNVAGYVVKETAGRDFLELIELVGNYSRVVELPD